MIRFYGSAPYQTLVLHGGPGAIGSLRGFAAELHKRSGLGIAEPLQSEYSVMGLVDELFRQTENLSGSRLTFIGHSWGAWLAALFAQKYPQRTEKLILIGCPPLETRYAGQINLRRAARLSEEEKIRFQTLLKSAEGNKETLHSFFDRTDNYCPQDLSLHKADKVDEEMMTRVWKEADQMRKAGEILSCFKNLSCELFFVFGQEDPHPPEGVWEPLKKLPIQVLVLQRCGHSPFMERYAQNEFYTWLLPLLNTNGGCL